MKQRIVTLLLENKQLTIAADAETLEKLKTMFSLTVVVEGEEIVVEWKEEK